MSGLVLLVVLLAWLTLPFVPALHEAFRRRDDSVLPISDRYREDLSQADAAPDDILPSGDFDAACIVRTTFSGEPGLTADEIRVRGVARLGEGTTVGRRLVVGDAVEVSPRSVLRGSAEAGEYVWLATAVQFERVHAPTINIGVTTTARPPDVPAPFDWAPPTAETLAGRALVRGDLDVPPGARVATHLVATGTLRLGAGVRIEGSVKAHGDVVLGPGARVRGSAFARGDVTVGPFASVAGAAVSEEALTLGPGATVGRLTAPTTASGRVVTVAAGARVHGTLWAEQEGRTVAAIEATGDETKTGDAIEIDDEITATL